MSIGLCPPPAPPGTYLPVCANGADPLGSASFSLAGSLSIGPYIMVAAVALAVGILALAAFDWRKRKRREKKA